MLVISRARIRDVEKTLILKPVKRKSFAMDRLLTNEHKAECYDLLPRERERERYLVKDPSKDKI